MKKQSIITMAMILGLAGSIALPTQAAGMNRISKIAPSQNCIIINGQICDLSDAQNALQNWCEQLQSGSDKNCSIILLPGCNLPDVEVKPDVPENNQPDMPENNQPDTEEIPNVPEDNQPEGETPEMPEQDVPNDNIPDVELPEQDEQPGEDGNQPNVPDVNLPEQDNSGDINNQPEIDNEQPETNPEELSYAEQVVELVNEERAKYGLSPLELDTEIASAALIRANEIKTLFSHTRPDGRKFSTVLTDNGIRFMGAGENIAWGQVSPKQVMNAWMNSDGHRANILNANYTKIGVGHYQDATGRNYWAQLFTY